MNVFGSINSSVSLVLEEQSHPQEDDMETFSGVMNFSSTWHLHPATLFSDFRMSNLLPSLSAWKSYGLLMIPAPFPVNHSGQIRSVRSSLPDLSDLFRFNGLLLTLDRCDLDCPSVDIFTESVVFEN